MHNSHHSCSW